MNRECLAAFKRTHPNIKIPTDTMSAELIDKKVYSAFENGWQAAINSLAAPTDEMYGAAENRAHEISVYISEFCVKELVDAAIEAMIKEAT